MYDLGWIRHRRRLLLYLVLVAIATGIISWILWPRARPPSPQAADNVSRNYRACLLFTSGNGSSQGLVNAVWGGLQSAADTGRVNAPRFPLPAADVPTALPYFNSAISRKCGVIVVAGSALAPAAREAARKAKEQDFVVVSGSVPLPNVTSVLETKPEAVSARVNALVLDRAGR